MPGQIEPELGVMLTIGELFTFTCIVFVFIQPLAFMPVTEYIVVVEGATTRGLLVELPGCQV